MSQSISGDSNAIQRSQRTYFLSREYLHRGNLCVPCHKTLNAPFLDETRCGRTRKKSCFSHSLIRVGGSEQCRYTIKHPTHTAHTSVASSLFDYYVRDGMAVRSPSNSPSNFSVRWNTCNNILFIRLFFLLVSLLSPLLSPSLSVCTL